MITHETDHPIPEFLFVCGAVGSGNTFMFSCLTQDENVYGINEDALGATLERFRRSEKEFGTCPHGVDAFVSFLHSLRRDRRTLILKTPSNIRRMRMILDCLPGARFILMIREPHAAIASGLRRHEAGTTVEQIARTWLADCQSHTQVGEQCIVATFDQLVRDPVLMIRRVSDYVLPLSPAVFTYASRMHRPERADGQWWRGKVDARVQDEIVHWVDELALMDHYRAVEEAAGLSAGDLCPNGPQAKGVAWHIRNARKVFFKAWYQLWR